MGLPTASARLHAIQSPAATIMEKPFARLAGLICPYYQFYLASLSIASPNLTLPTPRRETRRGVTKAKIEQHVGELVQN